MKMIGLSIGALPRDRLQSAPLSPQIAGAVNRPQASVRFRLFMSYTAP